MFRNVKENEMTGDNVFIHCPHCGTKNKVGQFEWETFECGGCKVKIPKTEWVMVEEKDDMTINYDDIMYSEKLKDKVKQKLKKYSFSQICRLLQVA